MVKAPTPTPVMAGMVVQKMPSGQIALCSEIAVLGDR